MRKLKKDNIAIIIAVTLIFAYIFYQCYSVSHIKLETQTAVLSTVYEKIDATALVVRDEHTIDGAPDGVTVACVSDGDKIKVGGNVAMNFSSSKSAQNYSRYSEVQEQLKYYENLEAQTVGQVANVETIDDEIGGAVNNYVRSVNGGDCEDIEQKGSLVNDCVVRRQMIIGENVDLVSIIQDLRKQADNEYSSSKPESYVKTDVSGVFSGYSDGLENLVDYEKAEELDAKTIKNKLQAVDKTNNKNEHFGKLITSYKWYFVCVVPSEDVLNLSDGQKVDIALKDNDDTVITMQIVSGAEPAVNQKETALILKSNMMTAKLATLRKEEIQIRIGSKEGFKVPAAALHVEDGKKGVYALISSQIRFREAEVIHTEDDYVLLNYDPDNKDSVRLYDKIIIQGKGLSDGKVYT
ncbi:MAG: hypothetical protein IJS03_08150 [Eubacterium sp.]|nr:hypothetical protein [Eubacterium sp.]